MVLLLFVVVVELLLLSLLLLLFVDSLFFFSTLSNCAARITLNTMCVGNGADSSLMEAIAFAGGGIFINVPGGTTTSEMESELIVAFQNVAAKLPPPKLIFDLSPDE